MLASVTWEWDGLGDCRHYAPDMQSVADFTRKMRLLEQLACPTEADRGFFNTHIQDLEPHSTDARTWRTLCGCAAAERTERPVRL